MDFTYGSAFSVDSPEAYETLILDALQGDASLFTRADEVEEAVGHRRPIDQTPGRPPAPRLPELRRRDVGPEQADELPGPARPALAPVLRPCREVGRPDRDRSCAGRPAHSIAEIEDRARRICRAGT
jgi:glucose-6-phosphate 1-dehydrogenase